MHAHFLCNRKINNCRYHLVDIGAILTHGKFAGDEDSVIERAKEAGSCLIYIL